MSNNSKTEKPKKGFYVSTMGNRMYSHFMGRLISDNFANRYDTYAEALQNTYDDIEATDEIHYNDGGDNWYHCLSRGHDNYVNEILLERLKNGDPCLSQGYYSIYYENIDSEKNPFEHSLEGYTYRYFGKPYNSPEELISEKRLKSQEDLECFYAIPYNGEVDENNLILIRIFHVDEDNNINEIKPEDIKKKTGSR